MPGEGELPLVELVQLLGDKGINHFWHVECIQGNDYSSDLRTVASRGLRSIKRVVEAGLEIYD